MLLDQVVAVAADAAPVALEPLKRRIVAGARLPVTVEWAVHRVPLPVFAQVPDIREQAPENGDYRGLGGVTLNAGACTRKGGPATVSWPITISPPSALVTFASAVLSLSHSTGASGS